MHTVTDTLAEFVASTAFSAVPHEAIERGKVCLLHNFGMALAGRRAEPLVHKFVANHYAQPGESTLFWDGSKVSAEGAVLANAALMHARTQDDTHFPASTHTGACVIPAALAMAEAGHATGEAFLLSMLLGYEAAARVGMEYDTLSTARGFRATAIYGVFGAAAASARLLGLTPERTSTAFAYAANLAGGLGQTWIEGTSEWRLQVGIAGRNGIFAARVAAAGASGARESLEGVAGFYKAFGGTTDHARVALDTLGKQWQVNEVTLKPYPVCAVHQSPVGMMIELADKHDLKPAMVEKIILELNPYEANYPGIDNVGPFTDQGGTLMSGQFCMALALMDRKATIDGLFRFDDLVLNDLAKRVHIVANESLSPLCSRLSVFTKNGEEVSTETIVDAQTHKFSFEQTAVLLRRLLPEMEIRPDDLERLIGLVRDIERAPDVEALVACMTSSVAADGVART